MRCKPCWTPMDRDGETHTFPLCGAVVTLIDPAYIPSPGYTPSPYRVPVSFAPLPSESGWVQEGDGVVVELEETLREKAQRERRERELLSDVDRAHIAALKEETRRVNQATALRGAAYRRNRLRLDAMKGAA